MGAPTRLHNISLSTLSGLSRTRSSPLSINHDTWGFSHKRVPYAFLHQTETWSRSCCHRFGASPAGSHYCTYRSQFVFHLDEYASDLWEPLRQMFCHLTGRRYRITCEKFASSSYCCFGACFVSLPKESITYLTLLQTRLPLNVLN